MTQKNVPSPNIKNTGISCTAKELQSTFDCYNYCDLIDYQFGYFDSKIRSILGHIKAQGRKATTAYLHQFILKDRPITYQDLLECEAKQKQLKLFKVWESLDYALYFAQQSVLDIEESIFILLAGSNDETRYQLELRRNNNGECNLYLRERHPDFIYEFDSYILV